MRRSSLIIFSVIIAASLLLTVIGKSSENVSDAVIRVLIADDRDGMYLALKARYRICAINSGTSLTNGPFLSTRVTAVTEGIKIGSQLIKTDGVRVKVASGSNIWVDNRAFRGDIDIIRKPNGKLAVINYIALDDYLYGVLYHEVSHRWPMAALKAQAIAARTFAIYQARQNKLQPYDLRNDIYSQVYGGRTSEKWSTTRAVNLTRGKALKYNGDIFPSYYHATCAGHTENASNLWNINTPPLKGVPCDFCKGSPHYRWTKRVSLLTLEKKLNAGGYKVDGINSFKVLSRDDSGRVDKIEIDDGAGGSVIITGKDFRQMIGPNDIRSAKFEASIVDTNLALEGFGWGHGVGMCQWGAYGMARQGRSAEEILKYYYPGAEITTL